MLQNRLFFALASRSGFGPAISDPVAGSSIVFCNSVFADRIVMAASRLLRAVAAFVIILSFAAGSRKSYWSGCMKAATVICQQISSILALVIFLLKILLKSASKSSFFRFGVEIRFWTCNFRPCEKKSCRGSESMQGLTEILSMPCAAWVRVWAFVECMTFWTIFLSDIRPKALCFCSFWR